MRVGMVMDPIERIHFAKDTTLGMCFVAQSYGWDIDYIPAKTLEIVSGQPQARAAKLTVYDNPERYYQAEPFATCSLLDYDLLVMRQDPPVDQRYTYHLMVLRLAASKGVTVANNPNEILHRNEKLGIAEFPELSPPSLVSSDILSLRAFAADHRDVIAKPLDGMGGKGIFLLRHKDPNINSVFETLTDQGNELIMVQQYIPQVRDGDKRIFLFNGEPWPWCLARIPQDGEVRANLAAGGRGETRKLTERDAKIATQVGDAIRDMGLYFVGLDVIGDYLTEINITSPTGAREMLRDTNVNPLEKFFAVVTASL